MASGDLLSALTRSPARASSEPADLSMGPILQAVQAPSFWDKLANYAVNDSIPAHAVKSAWSGLTFPGDVYAGKADPMDIGRALDTAGLATLGAGAFPSQANELRAGMKFLPSSSSLNSPALPTVEQLAQHSRLEPVNLSMARGSQPSMNWEGFNSGQYGTPLFQGYENAPVAALKRDGEYIVFDGHHRSVNALNEGQTTLPMHVIDASAYDPSNAGIAKPASSWSTDDEALLRELLGDKIK